MASPQHHTLLHSVFAANSHLEIAATTSWHIQQDPELEQTGLKTCVCLQSYLRPATLSNQVRPDTLPACSQRSGKHLRDVILVSQLVY